MIVIILLIITDLQSALATGLSSIRTNVSSDTNIINMITNVVFLVICDITLRNNIFTTAFLKFYMNTMES